jgi:uncharacterized membrane protein YphA (DoxX/SURF4 family)
MPSTTTSKAANVSLWVAQVLLALLFLFAGVAKLTMPAAVLTQQSGLPIGFLRFIAVAEIAGALGLVLPGLLRIRRDLTPLAAIGLVMIMAGAVTSTVATLGIAPSVLPLVVGLVLIAVIRGRLPWAAGTWVAGGRYNRVDPSPSPSTQR